jgi:hypothetical protein
MAAAIVGAVLFMQLRKPDLTLSFTREDLQQRVAAKFPFDQKLLFITVTYSNPSLTLNDGSDRIGIGLDAVAKLDGDRLVQGSIAGDWMIRYEPAHGEFYFDDPQIERFDIKGLSPSTQEMVARVAKPLIQEYLRRVPVYRLKPGDLRQDLARSVLKSVTVKRGKLYVVVGPQ